MTMGEFTHRDIKPANAPDAGAAVGTPGKRARTEALPPGRTGVDFVDHGTACERDEGGECFLTETQRTRLVDDIGNRAGVVGANARDALQDKRIDQIFEQPHGWGPLAEFLFYATTGPLIGTIMATVKAGRMVQAADHIQATLVNVSRAQRKVLQGMVSVAPGKESKIRFLELVRDSIGPWQLDLTESATATLDDAGLTGMKDGLDPNILTVDFFKARLADMVARFDRQQIDQVGVTAIYRHGELMWLGKGRRRRLVMLEDHGLHHTVGTGDGVKPRDLVEKEGQDGKPIVVDKDLEPFALAFYQERTGREPGELDVEAAVAKGGQFGKLASEMLLDVLTLGGAL
jgi:hypothetical protein